ncbi:hypothetical protein GCM10007063_10540 [Lentibacillus kapialis]|uniref:Regulatory protein YycH-like domain-containing protein n=1 Tax=Lentibacillus kapialis TaxID=340214 RepID=A0A917PSR0_9BACI|nr:two-component system regulatory protein YycI [Lentibacillus kapialis]GGJ89771.1 hypothetical protein GCM10007063_10540 [Lentibacillus kapialis]
MQWKQIKTLFILCFLILDVYLLLTFLNKQSEAEFALPDTSNSSFEEQLKSEDISISADLPSGDFSASYLSLYSKKFTDEELTFFDDKENQQAEAIDEKLILSRFDNPVSIPEDADDNLIKEVVKNSILLSNNYRFGGWNKEMNVLVFFQQKNGYPIYYNQKGIVLVYLNDDNEMIFYTQTMLGNESPLEEKALVEPITAIQALFDGNRLENGDEITNVSMGLHTRIPLESGEQVFSPAWRITVNDEESFHVNAIENLIVSSNEQTFLLGAISSTIEKVQKLNKDNDMKGFVLSHLNEKLTSNQQPESEIE